MTPRLRRWVLANFEPGSAERVLDQLDDLPDIVVGGQASERIQACLVIRTGGDWNDFQRRLALAKLDWRDALVAADLADADWPQRLDAVLGSEP
ncbi:MAG: hypothetical protein JO246_11605 [Frankiaceae bacterium]|nr:hypothetical protein [Frankiaceae bacterium]MBV9872903.1 hypothetical protein [Frankiaceae bacterium]